MVDICNAVDEWKARSATLAKEKSDKKSEFEAPGLTTYLLLLSIIVWVPDDQVSMCSLCGVKFTVLTRRVRIFPPI
jgi:hypothetical protein